MCLGWVHIPRTFETAFPVRRTSVLSQSEDKIEPSYYATPRLRIYDQSAASHGLLRRQEGGDKMSQDGLWQKVGTKCLNQAIAVLDHTVTPTEEMANLVQTLVSVAIAIDQLNLQWAAQNRYGAAVYQDPASARTRAKN